MKDEEKTEFIFVFFPFLFGVYPYTVTTEKQLTAMKQADVPFVRLSIFDIVYLCVKNLLAKY